MTSDLRTGEVAVDAPAPTDAGLVFIGRIRTPWASRDAAPRQGQPDGPLCHIEIFPPWLPALDGLGAHRRLQVIYWLHLARRDLVLQRPAGDGQVLGTFALRSPVRPNPLGSSIVELVAIEGAVLTVRGLDCVDGTPLLDLKPERMCGGTKIGGSAPNPPPGDESPGGGLGAEPLIFVPPHPS